MATTHDISAYRIFSHGAIGSAHAAAHRMLDQERHQQGHRQLGAWLRDNDGEGSQWVHVQWHMLVFELAVGAWNDAHARFVEHVLPAARTHAATDAPAGLWRLALTAPHPVQLPWAEVHTGAVARLGTPRDVYVKLHDLLALAGAGDTARLNGWLRQQRQSCDADLTLAAFARALCSYSAGDYAHAASSFSEALPGLSALGGSRAQNQLFHAIFQTASYRSAA
jgi:hypothetical protein